MRPARVAITVAVNPDESGVGVGLCLRTSTHASTEDADARNANSPASALRSKRRQAVRRALPEKLPRIDHRHEIEQTPLACGQAFKRIGEEVSEKLDCVPPQFFVQRDICGKCRCPCCQTIMVAPMPAQMVKCIVARLSSASGLDRIVTTEAHRSHHHEK